MMLWPTLLSGVLGFGIPVALRYQVRRAPAIADNLLLAASILAILTGLAATAIGVALVPTWLSKYSHQVIVNAQVLMIFAPNIMVGNVLQAILEAKGDFIRSNQIYLLPPLATLCTLLILAGCRHLNPFSASLAYLAPSVMLNGFMVYRIRWSFRAARGNQLKAPFLLLARYGLSAYALDIIGTLSQTIDSALVVGFLTSSGLGIYTISLAASRLVNIIPNSVNAVLFPKASALDDTKALALVAQTARIGLAASLIGGIAFALILPWLLPFVYGNAFRGAISVTRILTVEIIIQGTIATYAQAFMATGRPLMVTFLQTLGLCVAVPMMFVLIPRFGLVGAAESLLTSTIIRFVSLYLCYGVVFKRRFPSIVLTASDFRLLKSKLRAVTSAQP